MRKCIFVLAMTKFIPRLARPESVNLRSENFAVSLQRLIRSIEGSMMTEQIFIVINNVLWWRLYWNAIFQTWEVTQHTRKGWEKTNEFTTQNLLPLISENSEILERSQGFEHKTVSRVTIYRLEPRREVEP